MTRGDEVDEKLALSSVRSSAIDPAGQFGRAWIGSLLVLVGFAIKFVRDFQKLRRELRPVVVARRRTGVLCCGDIQNGVGTRLGASGARRPNKGAAAGPNWRARLPAAFRISRKGSYRLSNDGAL